MERPSLLHNMGAAPRALISHKAPQPQGRAISFRFASGASPVGLLATLDGRLWTGTAAEAEAELRRRINSCAATLPYPAAVLISDRTAGAVAAPEDLLTVCTVVAKSSSQVYLRDKEPNLANLQSERTVVLHIPEAPAC